MRAEAVLAPEKPSWHAIIAKSAIGAHMIQKAIVFAAMGRFKALLPRGTEFLPIIRIVSHRPREGKIGIDCRHKIAGFCAVCLSIILNRFINWPGDNTSLTVIQCDRYAEVLLTTFAAEEDRI